MPYFCLPDHIIGFSYIVYSVITIIMRFANLLLDSDQEAHSDASSGHESNVSDGT